MGERPAIFSMRAGERVVFGAEASKAGLATAETIVGGDTVGDDAASFDGVRRAIGVEVGVAKKAVT